MTDDKGRAVAAFVRFWDTVTGRIERQEAAQDSLIAQIIAAQATADAAAAQAAAAQATADDALAAAGDASGARYALMFGALPGTVTVDNITAEIKLSLSAGLLGSSIDANTSLDADATLQEFNGTTWIDVATASFTMTSTGLTPAPGEWNADGGFTVEGFGTYVGTVSYRVLIARTSGANFVQSGTINGTLTLTPKAT